MDKDIAQAPSDVRFTLFPTFIIPLGYHHTLCKVCYPLLPLSAVSRGLGGRGQDWWIVSLLNEMTHLKN